MSRSAGTPKSAEWGTFVLILACYVFWGAVLIWLAPVSLIAAVLAAAVLVAFHSSLTHEALHGHPFPNQALNEALMALPLNLCIPYNRFRDLHLAHHQDANLTDPYDDPESNYLDPARWHRMPGWLRLVYRVNNTLLGRMLLGPALGQVAFMHDDLRGALRGDREIWLAWALHLPGVVAVLWIVAQTQMPLWAYLVSAYLGLSLLKIRTFAEHRAHEKARGRTVIVEDRGPLALLFLNNNLHVVHHMHPRAPWYRLPELYARGKDRYRRANEGYVIASYPQLFRQHLWRAKDPVPHPLWPQR
ncbi:Fatty acid desaturase [Cribrihabitans marinus]|uniref:Fatty acid desaturase n=1 Tax=Cribrihabitans marinus TaxID=1227549 RepID=A0A1H6ZW67_9RHOB|nr:fatty acid desaturase [Cribrihabitans marinus]GGH29881.1 fatty acid desaturase [Cribrihabitans marinus]SEJ57591.1 Fatty acid desaturase [Cribrihabitans marinus]